MYLNHLELKPGEGAPVFNRDLCKEFIFVKSLEVNLGLNPRTARVAKLA